MKSPKWRFLWPIPALVLIVLPWVARSANPDALWHIVHEDCVPAAKAGAGTGACLDVRLGNGDDGIVVLKDRCGATQFLLLPTRKVTGIESPELDRPNAENYWREAWSARHYLESQIKQMQGRDLARDEIALTVNSPYARSQNQLHIHIDLIDPKVRSALAAHGREIGEDWSPLPLPPQGHSYMVRRLYDEDLSATDPFAVLAQRAAWAEMGKQTLAVVGATFEDGRKGFYLLSDQVSATDLAHAEELQVSHDDCQNGRKEHLPTP